MEKIFSEIFSDLHRSSFKHENPLESFLFNTKYHIVIMFYIASQKGSKSTLEEICYNVSPKVISRSTIQNILKEGVNINFLKKEISEKDKRSKFYKLTDGAVDLLEKWAHRQKKVFSKLSDLSNFK